MNDAQAGMMIPLTLRFFDRVVLKAGFKRKSDLEILFQWIRLQIPICSMMIDGQRMMMFAMEHALKANTELEFRDLIKRVWCAARDVDAANRHRLLVFFIGAGALCGRLSLTDHSSKSAKAWIEAVEDCIVYFLQNGRKPGTDDDQPATGDTATADAATGDTANGGE